MTKEQREAVERLRYSRGVDRLSGHDHEALQVVLALLTPPDEEHRAAIVAVGNPRLSRIKDTCEECRLFKRCEWGIEGTRIGVALYHRTFRPGPGCPWYEEEA